MVLKLLSTFLCLDSGSDGRYVQHMPMLHALISGISSVDAVHILSMYGLVRNNAILSTKLVQLYSFCLMHVQDQILIKFQMKPGIT